MNSIKYGKENGTTEVTIEDLVNEKIIVRIRDNGEGIEQQYIPRLFERFFRVDKSGARSEGGSGLGLSITETDPICALQAAMEGYQVVLMDEVISSADTLFPYTTLFRSRKSVV